MAEKLPQTLDQWRSTWDESDIQWRSKEDSWRDNRDQEKILRKKSRARRDRRFFGRELWGVSARIRQASYQPLLLKKQGLPQIQSEWELAEWLDIPQTRLRWFTHNKSADTVWHYVRYILTKKSGGKRIILAPKTELKAIQRKILDEILYQIPAHEAVHGFVKDHSIISNAKPHVGKTYILNIDLKDFFPSITFKRVRGVFVKMGYSYSVASVLALLCTESNREPITKNYKKYYVSIGERHLVQGAPTSPMLANLVANHLDKRLAGLAQSKGATYTRYADDITFSADDHDTILRLLDVAQRIIADEGFTVNTDKTHLYRPNNRQMVTGIVVNEKTATPRELRRRVRAILHQAQKTGLQAQNHDGHEHFRAYVSGLIAFIHQANPDHAKPLYDALNSVAD